jgi:hypothetical protein
VISDPGYMSGGDERFSHMSARDRVLARKREEMARKEEMRRRELAAAVHTAAADRAFAQQREVEQYRTSGAAKAVVGGAARVIVSPANAPGSRVSTADSAGAAAAAVALKLPGARYSLDDSLVDGDDDEEYRGVKYLLASAPGDAKPRPRGPAIVLPALTLLRCRCAHRPLLLRRMSMLVKIS